MLVVHPHRPAEVQGDETDLLAIARNQRQLAFDGVSRLVPRGRGPLHYSDRADVHVTDCVLDVQERGVLRAQRLHVVPLGSPPPAEPAAILAQRPGSWRLLATPAGSCIGSYGAQPVR